MGATYDAAGNLTSDGTTTSTYDALSRLAAQGTTTFAYNADGVLVAQASGGATTRYAQDLAAPLSQVLQVGATDYVYGAGRIAALGGTSYTWYATDALGSVRGTLDAAGDLHSPISYDPWGQVERGTVPTFGFTGELQQGDQVYLRARWYNAARGGFGSVDPFAGASTSPDSFAPYMYAYNQPTLLIDPSGRYVVDEDGNRVVDCPSGMQWDSHTGQCIMYGEGGGGGGSWDEVQTGAGPIIPVRPPNIPPTLPEPQAPLGPGMPFEPAPVPAAPVTIPSIPIFCEVPILLLTQDQLKEQSLGLVRFLRTAIEVDIKYELEQQPIPNKTDNNQKRWVVRGGIATPQQLKDGTSDHRDVPGLYGFSVQHELGKTITELAAAGNFRNKQISVTTPEVLRAAANAVLEQVDLVRSPRGIYHHTVQVPKPFSDDLAEALSIAFVQIPNPAPYR